MEEHRNVGVITDAKGRLALEGALPEGTLFEVSGNPDVRRTLREWSRLAVDVAVVDDDGLPYKEISEPDLLHWPAAAQEHPVRIVFVASSDRDENDPLFSLLVSVGIYDIVLRREGADIAEAVIERIERPARLADVATWYSEDLKGVLAERKPGLAERLFKRKGSESVRAEEPEGSKSAETPSADPDEQAAPDPSVIDEARARIVASGNRPGTAPCEDGGATSPPTPFQRFEAPAGEAPSRRKAEGARQRSRTIAAASLLGGAGTTHLAMSVAFWLARVYPEQTVVCVLSDKAEYTSIATGMPHASQVSFEYKSVTFCPFDTELDVRSCEWTVYDCGRLYTLRDDTAYSAARTAFAIADKKLMCVSGQPWNFAEIAASLARTARGEEAGWTWCAFLPSSELVRLCRAYLGARPEDKERWFRVPVNTEFFAPRKDNFHRIGYEALLKGMLPNAGRRKAGKPKPKSAWTGQAVEKDSKEKEGGRIEDPDGPPAQEEGEDDENAI